MLNGLGADLKYYKAPDAATQAIIAASGRTWEVVAPPSGMTVNPSTGEVTDARLYWAMQTDPFIKAGGNPLYQDPSNIPAPTPPIQEACAPQDSACVNRNADRMNQYNDLVDLYQKAFQGSTCPTCPDTYVAALKVFQAKFPTVGPGGNPAFTNLTVGPTPSPSAPTPGPPGVPAPTAPVVRPTVSTGSQATAVPVVSGTPGTVRTTILGAPSQTGTGLPAWAWVAGAGVAAFVLFGGKK